VQGQSARGAGRPERVGDAVAAADALLAARGQGPDPGGDIIDLDRRPPAA
jgi:hypothetical protein